MPPSGSGPADVAGSGTPPSRHVVQPAAGPLRGLEPETPGRGTAQRRGPAARRRTGDGRQGHGAAGVGVSHRPAPHRRQDFAGVAGMFAEDGMIFPPNEPAVSSRARIQAYLEAFPTITQFESNVTDVSGMGDMAVSRGTFRLTATVEGMPDPINDTGKWMTMSERQADGSWLAVWQMWNSDLPVPEPGT